MVSMSKHSEPLMVQILES